MRTGEPAAGGETAGGTGERAQQPTLRGGKNHRLSQARRIGAGK